MRVVMVEESWIGKLRVVADEELMAREGGVEWWMKKVQMAVGLVVEIDRSDG